MQEVVRVSTFLGIIGVIASFAIYYIRARVLHLSPEVMQSFIFQKLAVTGNLTIFVARTRGHFWSSPPRKLLFWSAVVTKVMATLVAVYGIYISYRRETDRFYLNLRTYSFCYNRFYESEVL
ncbi:H(+)-transporting ATPase [Methanosarcina siciliae C2J]|uniref:H(+)-transporting ATPase n=1 Tax=Methanosarcina siciliae C2J TaxID=1434118 RepID=A0A0E3PN71_9EURY|nr:hypothetical protein [Methanosarcina siciliae]AKB36379.1 H(+)-transporting ATPase [Methanosarcina siciliae C2J]